MPYHRTPAFLPGEAVAWWVDGQEATAEPALAWANDRQLNYLTLRVSGQQPQKAYRLLLPFVSR